MDDCVVVINMRSIDSNFYKSKEWRTCRESYLSQNPLCERCLRKGLIVPGEIVHHKIHLTTENYLDPTVSLNFENLETVCRTCHNQLHGNNDCEKQRWTYIDGQLQIKENEENEESEQSKN
jgi:hypothetical protein